jgi:hypothetical protein
MPSLRILAVFVVLSAAVVGAVVYAVGRQRHNDTITRLIPALLGVYALANVVLIAFLWYNHASFPLNLEAMELTVLQHFKRVMNGQPIYVEPSPDFVALAYNPLFYYLAAPLGWVFGTNLFTLRLVAIMGMFGSGLLIFLIMKRETGSFWWALMSVGLFAAAYQIMDTYLDNAHSDSWLLLTILLGCYLISLNRSRRLDLVGVLLLVLAFWFKQSGALFAVGAVLFLTKREGWRKTWPFWVLAIALGPVLYLVAPDELLGSRFHYYTWEVPQRWTALNLHTFIRLGGFLAKSYVVLAILSVGAFVAALWRKHLPEGIWLFLLPFALLNGLSGAMDSESNNNVFIPMGVWLIITGVQALRDATLHFDLVERRGVHIFALVASFALLVYNPIPVIVPPGADESYGDLLNYLESLDGPVYAPWIGQLQDEYQFYPAVHWVPMTDLVREPDKDWLDDPKIRELLEPVSSPEGNAYILMNFPLQDDGVLTYLAESYVLEDEFGDRFAALTTLPKRYNLAYPRYLYRYAPEEITARSLDDP